MPTFRPRRSAGAVRRRGERGSILPLTLVIIIIVSVTGAATLRMQSTASNASITYEEIRDFQLEDVDAAADSAIQWLRFDPTAAIDGGSGACGDETTYDDLDSLNGLTVYCQPMDDSGALVEASQDVPESSLLMLGGQLPEAADPGAFEAAPGTANGGPNPRHHYPFCADYHGFNQGSTTEKCEAGLFVGRGTTDTATGGLYVAYNGTDAANAPVIRSNGSIITGLQNASTPREVTAGGSIHARSYCAGGKNKDSEGTASDTWFPEAIKILASATGTKQCNQNGVLTPSPGYLHVPIDLSASCGAELCVPRVNGSAGAYQLSSSLCTGANDGFVQMPAKQIGTTGYYTAWYTSAADLNNLMTACPDSIFWFRPGVYYFDFLDVGTPSRWLSPTGCLHHLGNCTDPPSQIVGGTPNGWVPCGVGGAPAMPCRQPARALVPNILASEPTPTSSWTSPGSVNIIGDGQTGTGVSHDQVAAAEIPWNSLEVPIPQRTPGTSTIVHSVKVRVAYRMDQPATHYKPSSNDSQNRRGAELDVYIPDWGHCYLHLPVGDYLAAPREIDLTTGCHNAAMPTYSATLGYMKATGGFPSAVFGVPNTTYMNTPVGESVFKMHPEWVNRMQVTLRMKAETGISQHDPARVEVDGLNVVVEYSGRPSASFPDGCDRLGPGVQFIFGHTARVDWGHGADRQSFVELCTSKTSLVPPATGNGATTYQSRAGARDAAESAHEPGHNLGIGVYGLSSDSAPPPRTLTSAPATCMQRTPVPLWCAAAHPAAPTVWIPTTYVAPGTNGTSPDSSANPAWTSTSANPAGSAPVAADFADIGDGKYAMVTWPGGSNNEARLTFRLGDLSCPPGQTAAFCSFWGRIPAQSVITKVQIWAAHTEGGIVNGQFVPGRSIVQPGENGTQILIDPKDKAAGANGYQSSPWNTNTLQDVSKHNTRACTNTTGNNCNIVPAGTAGSPSNCNATPQTLPFPGSLTNMCLFEWGDQRATYAAKTATMTGKDWTWQRNLTDALSTVEGLSQATVTWTVRVNECTTQVPCDQHAAYLDGIVLRVEYRPAGDLRPLRGCLTTRTQWAPEELLGTTAPGYDWLDEDWGPNSNGNGLTLQGDEPFGNYSAQTGGNGTKDKEDCPLLNVANTPGRVKFHVEGMLYAPSAAFSLSGNDNDAQWSSDGIVARHLTALRWKNGGGIAAVGDQVPERENRRFKIEVRNANGNVLLRATVRVDDSRRRRLGKQVDIESWNYDP